MLFGAFISMFITALYGAWSDRLRTPFGRRSPFLVVGTPLNVVCLLGMANFPRHGDPSSLVPFILAFMTVNLINSMATAPFSALIPDIVPVSQRRRRLADLG